MAHKVHIEQQFADFGDVESAIRYNQNSENVQLFKRNSRALEAAKAWAPTKLFHDKLRYYEVKFHCIHRCKRNSGPTKLGKEK